MSDYTTKDAVELAFNGEVAEFRNVVNDLLMDKVYDAVQIKKYDVAANYMVSDEAEVTEED